ncbi:MAG: hypothetical protein HJJLKODD_02990 [Phycisphaerae bacterium]|nr:hypothetical protein [Phycisphaerae bacterium]
MVLDIRFGRRLLSGCRQREFIPTQYQNNLGLAVTLPDLLKSNDNTLIKQAVYNKPPNPY